MKEVTWHSQHMESLLRYCLQYFPGCPASCFEPNGKKRGWEYQVVLKYWRHVQDDGCFVLEELDAKQYPLSIPTNILHSHRTHVSQPASLCISIDQPTRSRGCEYIHISIDCAEDELGSHGASMCINMKNDVIFHVMSSPKYAPRTLRPSPKFVPRFLDYTRALFEDQIKSHP